MAHEIDLKRYDIYTDLVVESYDKENLDENIIHKEEKYDDILVENTEVLRDDFKKKRGMYSTITFKDISDKDNFKKVEEVLIKVLTRFLDKKKITMDKSCLVVGLGNELSTPDALGPNVSDKILVTKYLFELGEVESGYRDVSAFKPSVTGVTGIETCDFIKGVVDIVKPDFIIVIDALASRSIERISSTIQISDTGIIPGGGVGNARTEISEKTLGIPVIALGIPTVVETAVLVNDSLNLFIDKLQNDAKSNSYLNEIKEKDNYEEIKDALNPSDYNMIVTPKEIDDLIENMKDIVARRH